MYLEASAFSGSLLLFFTALHALVAVFTFIFCICFLLGGLYRSGPRKGLYATFSFWEGWHWCRGGRGKGAEEG